MTRPQTSVVKRLMYLLGFIELILYSVLKATTSIQMLMSSLSPRINLSNSSRLFSSAMKV